MNKSPDNDTTATETAEAGPDVEDFDSQVDFKEINLNEGWKKHRPEAYFEYRKMWDEVPRNKTELDFPINIDIETTDVCNLACPMCSRTIKLGDGILEDRQMTRDEYASIIDQSVAHGAKAVKLNYDGEPLAHKDVVWQVDYAKKAGILDVVMNTNGTLLKGKKAEGLLKAGVDGIFVSFDAASPDLFEERRVGTTLGRVTDNVHAFIKLRNEISPGTQIRINMVMYDDPLWIEQFNALKAMWGHLVDGIGYSPCVEYKNDELPAVDGWWCAQPFQRMVLKVSGKVTVCCPDAWDQLVVGNWREEKLYDIWHGERFSGIRRKHKEGHYRDIDLCRKCAYPHLEKPV